MLPFELIKNTPYLALSGDRASYGVSFMSTSTEIDRVIEGFYYSMKPVTLYDIDVFIYVWAILYRETEIWYKAPAFNP